MALRERMEYLLDLDVKGFVQGTKQAGDSLDRELGKKSNSVFGNIKQKGSDAFGSVKQHAGKMAIAGGAALAAFGAKAVTAFTDAAIAAGNFADSTGLSTEQASQWASVADDLGLSADTLQKSFLKMNKEIGEGGGLVEKYGLELKTTESGAADVNGTMLETIKVIGGIKDPTERAAAAQEVFGRSYAEVAEIVLGNADEIEQALKSTSEAQTFDNEEVEKARRYRATMDELNDVLTDLMMTTGEGLLPAVEFLSSAMLSLNEIMGKLKIDAVLEGFADLDDKAFAAGQTIREFFGGDIVKPQLTDDIKKADAAVRDFDLTLLGGVKTFEDAREVALEYASATLTEQDALYAANQIALEWKGTQDAVTGAALEGADAFDEQAEATGGAAEQLSDYRNRMNDAAGALEGAYDPGVDINEMLAEQAEALEDTTDEVEELTDAFAKLKGEMDVRDAWDDLVEGIQEFEDAVRDVKDAEIEFGSNSREVADANRDMESALRDRVRNVIDYIETVEGIPPETVSEIKAMLDRGSVAEAEEVLRSLEADRTATITLQTRINNAPQSTFAIDPVSQIKRPTIDVTPGGGHRVPLGFDSGGVVPGPRGQAQMAVVHGGETILPTHKSGGAPGGITIQVTSFGAPTPQLERMIEQAIDDINRRTGRSR